MTDQTALHRAHVALAAQAGRQQAALTRIAQMTDTWEQRLPEVIRTPAVVTAIRAALELAGAVPAADDTDLTESDIDRMMAAGVEVQIVTAPPQTHATDIGTEFIGQVDEPDGEGLAAFEAGLAGQGSPKAASKPAADPAERRRDRYAAAMAKRDGHPWPTEFEDDERDYRRRADAVMAVADAEQAELRTDIKRLSLMVDEYGTGASALTDKLKRARDMHRETCPWAQGVTPSPAFRCSMCDVLDAPAMPVQQPAAAPADDRAALRDRIAEAALSAVETAMDDTLLPAAREKALRGIAAVLPPPASRADVIAATARACAEHLRERYSDRWTADAAASLELNAARIERGEPTALLRRLADETPDAEAWDVPDARPGTTDHTLTQPPAVTVHAIPLPGSDGISTCCGRPPCEFVGERVTRDPDKVTCTGPAVGARQDGAGS